MEKKEVREVKETPEQVIDRLLSGYFEEAKAVAQEPKDFTPQGIRNMLAIQAGLFLSRQLREPDVEPPWFGQKLLEWAFPSENIKVTKAAGDAVRGEAINLISHIPRAENG